MCGDEKTTIENQTSSEQTVTQTPEEKQLNQRNLRIALATEEPQKQAQLQGLDLINQLLGGATELPGIFGTLSRGISPEAIGNQASKLTGQYGAGFQSMGLVDSGTAYKETARGIANELLFPTEQFNIG